MGQLTFTEEEVRKTAAFVQFVYDRAVFKEITTKESMAIPRHFSHMNDLIKKMDSCIFEIGKLTEKPIELKKKAKKK